MHRASRTPHGCYSAGLMIGEFECALKTAHFAASEGAADVAREILKGVRNRVHALEVLGVGTKKAVDALHAKFGDAISQKTPTMVERKTKYLLHDIDKFVVKSRQTCLGRKPRAR